MRNPPGTSGRMGWIEHRPSREEITPMVKHKGKTNWRGKQGSNRARAVKVARAVRITAETPYGECSERLTAFGGLLALVKFLDRLGCERGVGPHYAAPERGAK